MSRLKVAILGSGNIGTDLLMKVLRSPWLECGAFIGRNLSSMGMMKAQSKGVNISAAGMAHIEKNPDCCDIVFDATSAKSHLEHAPILEKMGKFVIDLTPAKVGPMCVPVVNLDQCLNQKNINMVTCGGQASAPIAHALALTHPTIHYIEVISSIAARSAGPATRINLDEYIQTTEHAIKTVSKATHAKAILNLNPAEPCINMQTTLFAKVDNPDIEALQTAVHEIAAKVQQHVPGYQIIINPFIENDRIVVMLRVKGLGDYLPEYAGNLDIINCTAIAVAEAYAKKDRHPIQNTQKAVHHEINLAQ